jgi:hypothetical protein
MHFFGKGILEPMSICTQVVAMGNVLGGSIGNIGGCKLAMF